MKIGNRCILRQANWLYSIYYKQFYMLPKIDLFSDLFVKIYINICQPLNNNLYENW